MKRRWLERGRSGRIRWVVFWPSAPLSCRDEKPRFHCHFPSTLCCFTVARGEYYIVFTLAQGHNINISPPLSFFSHSRQRCLPLCSQFGLLFHLARSRWHGSRSLCHCCVSLTSKRWCHISVIGTCVSTLSPLPDLSVWVSLVQTQKDSFSYLLKQDNNETVSGSFASCLWTISPPSQRSSQVFVLSLLQASPVLYYTHIWCYYIIAAMVTQHEHESDVHKNRGVQHSAQHHCDQLKEIQLNI